jgi:hypothetical protein
MHKALIIALGSLLFFLAACGEEEEAGPAVTPTTEATPAPAATATPSGEAAVSPTLEAVVCAADSTERFLEAQAQVPFHVFCPTFLPEGFELEELTAGLFEFAPGAATPPPDQWPGEVDATFTNPEEGASVRLMQGNLGVSLGASITRLASQQGIAPETTPFGELEGTLYAPLTRPPAGTQSPFSADVSLGAALTAVAPGDAPPGYALLTEEVEVDTVKEIAAGMRPVSP